MPILLLFKKYWLYVALALVVITICWQIWKPKAPIQETYHAEVKQVDGSIVAEVKPDAEAKPKHQIPKGATVERVMSVTVKPIYRQTADLPSVGTVTGPSQAVPATVHIPDAGKTIECSPVTVDLSLVRMPDESRRVVASSPDGEILSAVDIPVEAAAPIPEPKLWAAGAVADPFKRTIGGFLDRDLGWLRLGVQINQRNEGELPTQAWVKAGIRF